MGVKDKARAAMAAAGVPTLPGSQGILGSVDEGFQIAKEVGYPVILKATAGGGGRGMRIVREPSELASNFAQAQQEAMAAFSCPDLYLEKYIVAPRHIEFQILADRFGVVDVFGERECSIQRRHQKLIEESPSPCVDQSLRQDMSARLRQAMHDVGYTNAGTVEFVMDQDGNLHFIEVNARIQVEHPVTETVMGVDLVKGQIMVAAGEPLSSVAPKSPLLPRGHAIECRINAEDPETFAPCPGRITSLNIPGGPGVRVDTAAYSGCMIPPYYDSLVAKLITSGRDRSEAIARMNRALSTFVVEGIHTSIPLHQKILADPDFLAGKFDTTFVTRFLRNSK
jgi:acetyl-CoA carboxylase biotin carboxylase subunit